MNQTLEKTLLWGGLIATIGTMYAFLDKASKMTQVNPTNNIVFSYKTIQQTNQYETTNTNFKN
jgi:hypothetical protein